MLEKLTYMRLGLVIFAGFLVACGQEVRETGEVGSTQVELRSDLYLQETPVSSASSDEKQPSITGAEEPPVQVTRRLVLDGREAYSQDRDYQAVNRYEFLPVLVKDSKSGKVSGKREGADTNFGNLSGKYLVQGGKGFGVAAVGMTPSGTVRLDDTSYYLPTVDLKPYAPATESLKPAGEPFKSHKPLIFHGGSTGFAYEPPEKPMSPGSSASYETRLELSPIPETQVYFSSQPKTKVTLAPAESRLDLIHGNESLNQDRFYKLR
ncbi:MAG: hypothetical protein OEZ51_01450 [Nitrospinota bacterium]|nr:hypothetical protein [Nitrospinota bacterium]